MRETHRNLSPLCKWTTDLDKCKIALPKMKYDKGQASLELATERSSLKQKTSCSPCQLSYLQDKGQSLSQMQNKENTEKREMVISSGIENSKRSRNNVKQRILLDSTNNRESSEHGKGIVLSVEDMTSKDKRLHCDPLTETSDYEIGPDSPNVPCKKENMSRTRLFKRLLMRPLRRSKSDCCEKEISMLYTQSDIILENETTEISIDEESICRERLFGDGLILQERKLHKTCSADAAMMNGPELIESYIQPKPKSKRQAFKGLKKRFQFLRRRHTETALNPLSTRLTSLSYGEVSQWSKEFELLLSDQYGVIVFMDFLTSEFSEENLEFWIACREYKSLYESSISNKGRAQKIYDDFVAFHAPKEINLDSDTRMATITNLENLSKDTFDLAQHKIQALMEKDSYPRFIESELYQEVLEKVSR